MSACEPCGRALADDVRFCPACASAPEGPTASAGSSAVVAVMPSSGEMGPKAMDTNVLGALAYLAGCVTGIAFLALEPYKSNSFIRFHALQSIFFNVAWLALWILWLVLSAAPVRLTAGVFGFVALPLMVIFAAAGFGIWAFLMYQAYQQKLFRLPVVGKFAAKQAGVRL